MRKRMLVVSLLVILTTAMRPQEWAYSCELASLVNALDGIGIRIDEPTPDGRGSSLQWFERARLEIASDGQIVRGLVGRESQRGPDPASPPAHIPASMPELYHLGETEAHERLVAMGIREIVVDYQERAELGDLFDQVAPYTVVSHHPTAGTPVSTSDVVILDVRGP